MPDDTPVTTTTRSGLMMTPRLGPGLSSYCERSQPASNQSSCCCALAAAPGPPAANAIQQLRLVPACQTGSRCRAARQALGCSANQLSSSFATKTSGGPRWYTVRAWERLRFSLMLSGLKSEGSLESSREWLRSRGCAPSAIVQSLAQRGARCFVLLCSLRALAPTCMPEHQHSHSSLPSRLFTIFASTTPGVPWYTDLRYQAGEPIADGCSLHSCTFGLILGLAKTSNSE